MTFNFDNDTDELTLSSEQLLQKHLRQSIDPTASKEQQHLQRRANRKHALGAWASGGNGNRWSGDDGRVVNINGLGFEKASIQAAEQAKFDELNAVVTEIQGEIDAI